MESIWLFEYAGSGSLRMISRPRFLFGEFALMTFLGLTLILHGTRIDITCGCRAQG